MKKNFHWITFSLLLLYLFIYFNCAHVIQIFFPSFDYFTISNQNRLTPPRFFIVYIYLLCFLCEFYDLILLSVNTVAMTLKVYSLCRSDNNCSVSMKSGSLMCLLCFNLCWTVVMMYCEGALGLFKNMFYSSWLYPLFTLFLHFSVLSDKWLYNLSFIESFNVCD